MEWIASYYLQGDPEQQTPDIYTFVGIPANDHGEYPALRMPDSPMWPYSPILYIEYELGGMNERLGERVTLQQLAKKAGGVILDRFFSRIAYRLPQDEDGSPYGRDENGQIIREEE